MFKIGLGGCLELQRIDKGKRWNDFSRGRLQPTIVGSGVFVSENHELSLGSFFFLCWSARRPQSRQQSHPFCGSFHPDRHVTGLPAVRALDYSTQLQLPYYLVSPCRKGFISKPNLEWFGGCSGRLIFHWPKL